ncbi:hypothetical protein [Rossellomorea sp. NS-SX7]|uniref:hypothetical protein n=1 Tax=Rossellomorea sp. NS-SX7 TaxID=3463856 RepID=UPI004059B59A
MLKVNVKVQNKRYSIPVPYAILHVVGLIITSKRINRLINKAIKKGGSSTFTFPEIKRNELKPLLRELSKYRGLILVDTRLKDGTEVVVKL